ncbi:MAG: TRAP transporter small permease [Rhodobacteraceae bacterium]|nr:TRAP transporter small permease [Alphaproteobacteria bacterium]MBT8475857.1 TRAP transporter small permease [Alphaproteobacteria bacterium]NNK65966.1 TRAP transporter small permease [Paracoccaceae bacterium]
MALLKALLLPLQLWNDVILKIGRGIGIVAIGLMVAAILIQVFFRYVLNNALPWPDEAARFMMLWLTGLMAPTAYRRGGFVAIDLAVRALPERIGAIVSLFLLVVALAVLLVALPIGWKEVTGFSGSFTTASLQTVFIISFTDGFPWLSFEFGWFKMPRSQMMASLLVGVFLLIVVNIELIIRSLIVLLGGGEDLRPIPVGEDEIMAE